MPQLIEPQVTHVDATDQPPATVVVVAYRQATIALADEVVWLENGRVGARGSHEQLLAEVPGYRALVRAYSAAEVGTGELASSGGRA